MYMIHAIYKDINHLKSSADKSKYSNNFKIFFLWRKQPMLTYILESVDREGTQ